MNTLTHNDKEFINKLKEIIRENLSDENFGTSELTAEYGISRSGLFRKLKQTVKKSGSRFIREIRLEKAKEMLLSSQMNISEVAYAVGFASSSYFNKCFHEHFGIPPGELRHQTVPVSEAVMVSLRDAVGMFVGKFHFKNMKLFGTWMLLIVLLVWFLQIPPIRPPAEKTIAVLPFVDDSRGRDHDWILSVLRSEVMCCLGHIKELTVVSQITSENYSCAGKSAKEIGRDLKTDYLLTGYAQTVNDTCRLVLQLTEAANDRQIWVIPFEPPGSSGSIFDFRKKLAFAIAGELGIYIGF